MRKLILITILTALNALSIDAQHRMIVDPKVYGPEGRYHEMAFDITVSAIDKIGFIQRITSDSDKSDEADYKLTITLKETINRTPSSDDIKFSVVAPLELTVTRLSDNVVVGSKTFNCDGISDENRMDAIEYALSKSRNKIIKYLNDIIPYYGKVIEISEVKGDKANQLYISLGSRIGINKGQELIVKQQATVAGKPFLRTLGKIKVIEVEGEEGSRCKVTEGNKEIYKAYLATPDEIVIETHKKWTLFDDVKSF